MTKKIYLIDGSNYIYRAYYAIPHLSNSKGFPTNALLGFTQMLLKIVKDECPEYIGVVFDTKEPTFRDEEYKEYKANRKEPPDDLIPQFPYFPKIVESFNIPIITKPGFEADDVIGTIAKEAVGEGFEVVILTGDKDMMQLVNDNVSLWDSMRDKHTGIREVHEKFGVAPGQVADVLGLAGDASDNIPGVLGVGDKTASKLVQEYGSVEAVIKNVDKIKGKLSVHIKRDAESARLSKKLATIVTNVPLDVRPADFKFKGFDKELLNNLFDELEFTRLKIELVPRDAEVNVAYDLILTEAKLDEFIRGAKAVGSLSINIEGSEANPWWGDMVGISLSCQKGSAFYIPVAHTGLDAQGQLTADVVISSLKGLFEDKAVIKYGHDLKRDMAFLSRRNARPLNFVDTMIVAYVLNPSDKNDLADLVQKHFNCELKRSEEVIGKGKTEIKFSAADIKSACAYACQKADYIFRLGEKLSKELEESKYKSVYFDIEMPLIEVLSSMEGFGVKVDEKVLGSLKKEFGGRLGELEGKIYKLAGEEFNINSPKQLGAILFEKLQLPGAKKTKTGYSTNADILESLSDKYDITRLVLEYRTLSKLVSTYIEALPMLINPKTGRIHTSFNQAVTATGRLSSSDPNLQNIPIRSEEGRRIREAFIADEGFVLMSADYSQIELRILAHVSKDKALIDAFNKGVDIHALTASGIFGVSVDKVTKEQRSVGKTVNFATIYGQTAFGLSKQLGIGAGEASRYIENYFKKYPEVEKYRNKVLEDARRNGYVETIFKRRRYVPDINSTNGMVRQIAEREAFNMVFQGANADIIKMAMITIYKGLPGISSNSKMLMQVHDELVFDVPEKDKDEVLGFVRQHMEGVVKLDVPIIVDVRCAKNWADAH